MQKIIPLEKQQEIYDSIFGVKKDNSSAVQQAAAARNATFQDWLNTRKKSLEQQRTDDIRMAKYNALGNLLTTMVQPLGWAIGGSTAGVQPYDNRQYLEAFNRAVKASDDLRNLGNVDAEYQFKLADEEYQRQLSLADEARRREAAFADFKQKQDYQAKQQAEYAKQRHEYTMAEIAARGENQKSLAEVKAKYKVLGRDRVPVEEKMLQAAWTRYMDYKKIYEQDTGRGIVRQDKFKSFKEWAGEELGWILNSSDSVQGSASGNVSAGQTGVTTKPSGKVGGFQTPGASSVNGKTGGFVR